MSYSVMCWNIENFSGKPERAKDVARRIKKLDPDLIGILELKDKGAAREFVSSHLKNYNFGITDTRAYEESGRPGRKLDILVGWKPGSFSQVVYTTRREFTMERIGIRPGALVSVRRGNRFDNVLFLHSKSGPDWTSYGMRQTQLKSVWKLRRALDKIAGGAGRGRLMVVGDLNTMGNGSSVDQEEEIDRLIGAARKAGMWVPSKTHDRTYANVSKGWRSDLDHVLVSNNIELEPEWKDSFGNWVGVRVTGWVEIENDREKLKSFTREISDHSALFARVR